MELNTICKLRKVGNSWVVTIPMNISNVLNKSKCYKVTISEIPN